VVGDGFIFVERDFPTSEKKLFKSSHCFWHSESFKKCISRSSRNFAAILKDAYDTWFSMFETIHFLHSEACHKTIFKWTSLVCGFNLETKNSTVLILASGELPLS